MSVKMDSVDKIGFSIMFAGTIIGASIFTWHLYKTINEPRTKIEIAYDCRLAEISPDYPQLVKEKCRKLMQPKVYGVSK
jgi:hypothetical protein